MASNPFDRFDAATPSKPPARRSRPASNPFDQFGDAPPSPTGQVYDGDTLRLSDGRNGRLYGADAFELRQEGRTRDGAPVPLGQQAREAFVPYAQPGATVTPIGPETYGRPVVSVENGGDAAQSLIAQGYALATPEYLLDDPERLRTYMQEERLARMNRRGAHGLTYQTPGAERAGNPEPWAAADWNPEPGEAKEAVFADEPTPFQGLRPETEAGFLAIWQDLNSKPGDLIAYAKANGFEVDKADTLRQYAKRDRDKRAGGNVTYGTPPRILTDLGDGGFGAAVRGFGDPINFLDEAGAVVDTLGGTPGRENIFSSDRRFGDILANNLGQNKAILSNDEENYPWWRLGGQVAGGVVAPGASIEGVGLNAARTALRGGATRFAAQTAAERAVAARLAAVGAVEGSLAGAGAGESLSERATGAVTGAPVGAALGLGAGYAVPRLTALGGRLWSRLRGRGAEAGADVAADARAPDQFEQPAPVSTDGGGEAPSLRTEQPQLAAPAPEPIDSPPEAASGLSQVTPTRAATNLIEARSHAVDFLNEPIRNEATGIEATVSRTSLGKMTSQSATGKSVSPELHAQAVANADELFRGAQLLERRPDPHGEGTIEISRWGVNMATPDGLYPVKLTAKLTSHPNNPNPLYTVEVSEVGSNLLARRRSGGIEPEPVLSRNSGQADPAADVVQSNPGGNVGPRDVLPLPSNTVDGLAEAERIDAGRVVPVRAPNERAELARHDIRSATDGTRMVPRRGPADLVTWVREQGGVRPQGGELQHYGITNAARKGTDFAGNEAQIGPLINENGLSYDQLGELAYEAGFLDERPTVAEFLDALAGTHSGRNRLFRPEDMPEVNAFEAARRERYAVESARQEGAPLAVDRGEPVDMADLDRNAPPVRAYEEWGENAPDFAGNIRLGKLESSQDIKRALASVARVSNNFDGARRGRITQAETAALADDLGMTAADLLKRRAGQALNAEQALAARQLLAKSGAELVNMARRIERTENPGDELQAAFNEALLRHAAIQEQVSGATAEAGRALAQFRMVANGKRAGRVLPDLASLVDRGDDIARKIVEMVDNGVDARGVNQFIPKAMAPRWQDMANELIYAAKLSSPSTHVINILSNSITSLSALPEHATAAAIGGARRALGKQEIDRVLFSELGPRAVGLLQGTKEGMGIAARTFVTGEVSDPLTKIEATHMRAIPGKAGSVIRTPLRALMAEDELFKSMARRMELSSLAVRKARQEGLKGEEAKARVADLLQNPTGEMIERAIDYGREMTFQAPLPYGSNSAAFAAWANRSSFSPLIKLIVPFIKTPLNLLKFAAARSPAAPLLKDWRADYVAGGVRRDLALAKMAVGTGMMALAMEWAEGGKISGGGPADKAAQRMLLADGRQPYSVKVGDTWYSYQRLDPFATTVGIAADFADLQSHMTDKQRENVATLMVAATIKNLSNKVWLSSAIDLSNAIGDPERYGQTWINKTVAGLAVPAIVGQTARTSDPYVRDVRSVLDAIRARVPGQSQGLPVKRDVLGRPIMREGGLGPDVASPIATTRQRNDPIVAALLDAGISLSPPSRKVGARELTPAEYADYVGVAGDRLRPALAELVGSEEWKAMDQSDRSREVRRTISEARREARELLGL